MSKEEKRKVPVEGPASATSHAGRVAQQSRITRSCIGMTAISLLKFLLNRTRDGFDSQISFCFDLLFCLNSKNISSEQTIQSREN